MNTSTLLNAPFARRLLGAGSLLAIAVFTTGCEMDGTADSDEEHAVYYSGPAYTPTPQPVAYTTTQVSEYQDPMVFPGPNATYRQPIAYADPSGTRYYREPQPAPSSYQPAQYQPAVEESPSQGTYSTDSRVAPEQPVKTARRDPKPKEEPMISAEPVSKPLVESKPVVEGTRMELPKNTAPASKKNEVAPPTTGNGAKMADNDTVGASSIGYAVATYR